MVTSTFSRTMVARTGQVPDRLRLLQDVQPLKVLEQKSVVSESAGVAGRPALRITGIFQKIGDTNQNGRRYPHDVIAEAVKTIQEDITNRAVMGEYDHPQDAKIHLDRVSHLITKLWVEGKYVYGVAEVLRDMPCGNMLAVLLENKVQVGISSRGVGDMEVVTEGSREVFQVQPGYQFVTFDIVGEPSVSEATMHVMESRNRLMRGLPTRSRLAQTDPKTALIHELHRYLRGSK